MSPQRNRLGRRFVPRRPIGAATVEGLESRVFLSVAPHGLPLGLLGGPKPSVLASLRCAAGSVVSVDTAATPNTITIESKAKGGALTQSTYSVDPAAKITVDGATATLGTLVAGVKVAIKLSPTDPTVATSITAIGKEAEGKVTAVNTAANTITLAGKKGGPDITYNVGNTAKITLNGKPVTLAEIVVGAKAELKLSALDATTAISVKAHVEVKHAFGAVTSVDTAATPNMITLDVFLKGGTTTSATYKVDPAAKIIVDGNAATLGTLVAGVKVALTFSIADPTLVTQITALSRPVEGKVTAVDTGASTITLAGKKGGSAVTYTVSPTAVITVNGKAATLADVVVGARVVLTPSALDSTIAVKIRAGHH